MTQFSVSIDGDAGSVASLVEMFLMSYG